MLKLIHFVFLILISNNLYGQLTNIFVKTDSISFDKATQIDFQARKILKLNSEISLTLLNEKTFTDEIGFTHYSFQLKLDSIRIENASIKIHTYNNKITSITGNKIDNISTQQILLTEQNCFELLSNYSTFNSYIWLPENDSFKNKYFENDSIFTPRPIGKLVYIPVIDSQGIVSTKLCYKYDVFTVNPSNREYVYVSAVNGDFVDKIQFSCFVDGTVQTKYSGERLVKTTYYPNLNKYQLSESGGNRCYIYTQYDGSWFYDINNYWTLAEYDDINSKNAALDIHWGAEMFYDYFKSAHNRLSWNNTDGLLKSNYNPLNLDRAGWLGGFAEFYKGKTKFSAVASIDVVGHEFGHGVSDASCDLIYENESGAIDESLSDIWGACIENYADPTKNKWLMGEEFSLLRPSERSFINPKDELQPNTYMGDYWFPTTQNPSNLNDFGGVHYNSGVMNYWFYLLSEGGNGINDNNINFSVEKIGMDKAAKIVYRAETVYFNEVTNFEYAREYTIQATRDLYGNCSKELEQVIRAWNAVGVGISIEEANTLLINQDLLFNESDYKYAFSTIIAVNKIEDQSSAIYEASESINLKNGFHCKSGASFHASITECNLLAGGIQKNTESSNVQNNDNFDNFKSEFIQVLPNPVDATFKLLLDNSIEGKEFHLINNLGKIVYSNFVNSENQTYDIQHLEKGLYFIYIKDYKSTAKIIKS